MLMGANKEETAVPACPWLELTGVRGCPYVQGFG